MKTWLLIVLSTLLPACAAPLPDLADLAARPPLDASVLLTGGAFVRAPEQSEGQALRMPRTFAGGLERQEGLSNQALHRVLQRARVFAGLAVDGVDAAGREALARTAAEGDGVTAMLRAAMRRAQTGGHDFVLVVEEIRDAVVEDRGINDRWPFTLGAWLFALGSLIPDRTYESRARLQLSLRDAHSGQRVMSPLLLEPGSVDLNMFGRCGLWGFVQSLVVPPFWTSTDAEVIVANVRHSARARLLVAVARRLKSAEVREALRSAGPVSLDLQRRAGSWALLAHSREPLRALAIVADGQGIATEALQPLETRFLASVVQDAGRYRYQVALPELSAARLRVLVQTEAARVRSATFVLEGR